MAVLQRCGGGVGGGAGVTARALRPVTRRTAVRRSRDVRLPAVAIQPGSSPSREGKGSSAPPNNAVTERAAELAPGGGAQVSRCRKKRERLLEKSDDAEAGGEGLSDTWVHIDNDTFELNRELGKDVSKPYDQNRWRAHQSSERYVRHIQMLKNSRILHQLKGPVLVVTAMATAVCGAYSALASVLPIAPLAPFTLTASIVGLLLAFRTNAAYSRWAEARSLWGMCINRVRDINRQASTWWTRHNAEDAPRNRQLLQRWSTAFSTSLKCHLRERGDLEDELKGVLPQHELSALLASNHRPLFALQVISDLNARSASPDLMQIRLDRNLTQLEDVVGACERLLRTPIPVAYTRHTSRLLVFWLMLLPVGLWGTCGWATVPTSACIAAMLLGIEEIGVTIEEPFSRLPLGAMCHTIERNTHEQLENWTSPIVF